MGKEKGIRELLQYLEGNVEDNYQLDYTDVDIIIEALETMISLEKDEGRSK